jgi:hypothetical protein
MSYSLLATADFRKGRVSLDDLHRLLLADIERLRELRKGRGPGGFLTSSDSTGQSNSKFAGQTDLESYVSGTGFGSAFEADVQKLSFEEKMKFQQLYQVTRQLEGRRNPFFPTYSTAKAERTKGGVMTDHSTLLPGRRTIATRSTSGSPPVTSVSTIVQPTLGFQTILDNVASVKGNHKTPNPHRFRVKKINYGKGFSDAGNYRNGTTIQGDNAVGLSLSAPFTDAKNFVYNKALSKLYDQLRDDIDLSVDAFQAKQTGVMLNQRFKQGRDVFLKKAPLGLLEIVKIAKRMKRSNPRDWGSLWLEWTYGWKPLAADIFGSVENMMVASTRTSQTSGHPVRCGAQEMGDSRTVKTFIEENVYRTQVIDSIYQCRFNCFYAIADSRLNSVAGYTSLNPVSIAWELVPYSFVADWFVNVGGYLRNMESSLLYGSDFVNGYVQERSKQAIKETVAGSHTDYVVEDVGSVETKTFQRTVLSGSPGPRPPSFNPKLGTSRLISAASLLSQQLHSLKHKR